MTRVSNFFYFFRNSSVTLTLFLLCPEKFDLVYGVALAIDTTVLELFFFNFFLISFFLFLIFDIWFIIIMIFNLFQCEFYNFIMISNVFIIVGLN